VNASRVRLKAPSACGGGGRVGTIVETLPHRRDAQPHYVVRFDDRAHDRDYHGSTVHASQLEDIT